MAKQSTSDKAAVEDLKSVTIRLESGEDYEIDLEKELAIPRDRDKLFAAARKAPKRVVFWNHQTERALAEVRRLERKLDYQESMANLTVRSNLKDRGDEFVSEGMVRAGATVGNKKVRALREKLDKARYRYGLIRSIREAVSQRAETIRAMVSSRA